MTSTPSTWQRLGSLDADAAAQAPSWLRPLLDIVPTLHVDDVSKWPPPHGSGHHSAVLVLFGPDRDLLLIERAGTLRAHAGQPAFPGGRLDEGEDARTAALREAAEETGLDPAGVVILGTLPDLWIPVTDYVVTPVLGWWPHPSPVAPQDPAEVTAAYRVALADLADPARRCTVRHPSGYVGPGFEVHGMLVWGFTAGVVSALLDHLGLTQPWTPREVPLP